MTAPVPFAEGRADDGPGRWWSDALWTESLACNTVEAARSGAQALADARGQHIRVDTSPELIASAFASIDHLRVDGSPADAWAPLSGFHRTADGWVRLHANYPHHAAAIERALGTRARDALREALASLRAGDVEAAVRAEGGIGVRVRSPEEWDASPPGRAAATEPWHETTSAGKNTVPRGGSTPMEGVRVLDLTRVIAGPTCSQLLACLGAEVLRIDPPARPEILDQHLSTGMGKRSAALDLAAHAETVHELLAHADVVLLGYRPGSLDRFGLEPQDLSARRPDLVIGSLSAWGWNGPWAHTAGFDSIVQAASGIAMLCGTGSAPGALSVQALDHGSGHRLAGGIMRLLSEGRGGIVRVSLIGAALALRAMHVPPADRPIAPPSVRTVTVASPHGTLRAVPPALTLDGRMIERPVGGLGAATPSWLPEPPPRLRSAKAPTVP
ncbi:CoA transferase [Brachybacterium huguangmaarense]